MRLCIFAVKFFTVPAILREMFFFFYEKIEIKKKSYIAG